MQYIDLSGQTEEVALRLKQAALVILPAEWARYKAKPQGRFLTGELSAFTSGFSCGMNAVIEVLRTFDISLQVVAEDEDI